MQTDELVFLFQRDLALLLKELASFENEDQLWVIRGDIKNSPGNLMMHLVGNLQHYIGAELGTTQYVRDRDREFSGKMTREELRKEIERTSEVVAGVLEKVPEGRWDEKFADAPPAFDMTVRQFVLHLYGHFNWHLGQINYHRRLLLDF